MNLTVHASTSSMGQTPSLASLPPDSSPAIKSTYRSYRDALSTHLKDRESVRACLLDSHHEVWRNIVSILQGVDNADTLNEFLQCHFKLALCDFPEVPPGSERREFPKKAERVLRKIYTADAQAQRSVCVDWIACRILAKKHQFSEVKRQIEESFPSDVVLVWRNEEEASRGRRDIIEFGYAYKLGGGTIMEVQVLEEAAKWVFEMNSRKKHASEPGCVSFKESKELFNAFKKVILDGWPQDRVPCQGRVREYYEQVRGNDGEPLDYEELDKFQTIVDEVLARK